MNFSSLKTPKKDLGQVPCEKDLCEMKCATSALAPKAKVLRCHYHHARRGGVTQFMGVACQWVVAQFMRVGGGFNLVLG